MRGVICGTRRCRSSSAFCVVFAPVVLDQAVMAVFIAYGAALLWALRGGRDSLAQTRLDSGEMPVRIWRVIGVALIVSAMSDGMIVAAQMAGYGAWQGAIIGVFFFAVAAGAGGLGLSRALEGGAAAVEEPSALDAGADADLMARLDAMMVQRAPYLEPELTLGQLARRLHVPMKSLSGAINRSRGENVSRYINGHRIAHACGLLNAGENVTQAMLASGFNTKSNFNREFLRVMGQAPTDWLRGQDVVDKAADAP